ncbi:uncharacterized protein [Eurosta solidaginis]|uniref:uncharacterized protein n=1 Tax=Eurosta solidaginis TaxID=178769 RepID=UPI00353086AD
MDTALIECSPTPPPNAAAPVETSTSIERATTDTSANTEQAAMNTSTSAKKLPGLNKRSNTLKCRVCDRSHPLRFCKRFIDASFERRLRLVLLHRYCSRCLAHSHITKNCKSTGTCHFCGEKHHSLLHSRTRVTSRRELPPILTQLSGTITVLPTVAIYIHIGQRKVLTRALLDSCSPTSKVCNSLVRRLRIPTVPVAHIDMCELYISSSNDSHVRFTLPARVMPEFELKTPTRHLSQATCDRFVNMMLADPGFHTSSAVAVILGGDIYHKIIKTEIVKYPGYPTAQNSVFGWVLSGPCVL